MEVIPLQASGDNIDNAYLAHLLLDSRILTDVEQNKQTYKK
jgi:hypothetical protein